MERDEVIRRLNEIASHSVHTIGEEPFVMSLDDGIAVYEAIDILSQTERKRGMWIDREDPFGFFDSIPVCSECGCTTKMRDKSKYCPNCGSEMTEGEDDEAR